jgi:hypothetical protein
MSARQLRVRRCSIWSMLACATMSCSALATEVFITYAIHETTGTPQAAQVEAAAHAKESRPADNDPEGNWSAPINGVQLSIRFEKTVFRLGEPIMTHVIFRNIGDVPLKRTFASGKGFVSKLCGFIVTRDDREPVERTGEQHLTSVKERTLYPKAQWKSPVILNEMFKMDTPGSYHITGMTGVGKPPEEIRTATVLVQVVADASLSKDPAVVTPNSPPALPAIPNVVTPRTVDQSFDSIRSEAGATRSSSLVSKPAAGATPLASVPPTKDLHSFSSLQKAGMVLLAGLLAVLLAILWRAARRKPEA